MLIKTLVTIGLIVVTVLVIVIIESLTFKNETHKEIGNLIRDSEEGTDQFFHYKDLKDLPEPVQKYFRRVLKDGQPYIRLARIEQTGVLKLEEGTEWNRLTAEEYFSTPRPALLWKARVKLGPILWIRVRDLYYHGTGSMLGKLFSTITALNSRGPEMDASSLFRFLREAVWFPTALLPSGYLSWEKIDRNSARAIITDYGITVSAVFMFDDHGEILQIVTSDTYRDIDGTPHKERWTGYYRQYREINGNRVPTEMEAVWNLKNRDFKYARLTVSDVQYR